MMKTVLYGAAAIGALLALGIVVQTCSTISAVATAPGRVISKTLDTNNIINNYEWFHDANAAYQARLNQIREFKGYLDKEADASERARLRMEMSAQQQSCRELATRYNANSIKTNRSIFKGREAPEELDPQLCEVKS